MTDGGDALKRFRRARRWTIGDLAERTVAAGRRVSASQIGKVERGERTLTDEVFEALAAALGLDEGERAQVTAARSGTGGVDVAEEIGALRAEIAVLRGELRGSANLIMGSIDRLRDALRP